MKKKRIKANMVTFLAVFITAFASLELIPDSFSFKMVTVVLLITVVAFITNTVIEIAMRRSNSN